MQATTLGGSSARSGRGGAGPSSGAHSPARGGGAGASEAHDPGASESVRSRVVLQLAPGPVEPDSARARRPGLRPSKLLSLTGWRRSTGTARRTLALGRLLGERLRSTPPDTVRRLPSLDRRKRRPLPGGALPRPTWAVGRRISGPFPRPRPKALPRSLPKPLARPRPRTLTPGPFVPLDRAPRSREGVTCTRSDRPHRFLRRGESPAASTKLRPVRRSKRSARPSSSSVLSSRSIRSMRHIG